MAIGIYVLMFDRHRTHASSPFTLATYECVPEERIRHRHSEQNERSTMCFESVGMCGGSEAWRTAINHDKANILGIEMFPL